MRKSLLILILTLISATVGFGQKTNPSSMNENNSKQQRKISSKNESNIQLNTALEAELQKTLDAKNSKIGDEIVLKVSQNIKQNGEIVIPKGAKIIGHVTQVQEKTKSNAMSKLDVVFNRIEGKNLNAPISATITSIINVASKTSASNDLFSSDVATNSNSNGRVSSNSSGGGLLGGVTNTVGGVVNTTANTVGDVTNTAGQTIGSTTRTVGNTANGIKISQSANTSVNGSTTLSAQNKNLKLEKGTMFRLFVNESVEN